MLLEVGDDVAAALRVMQPVLRAGGDLAAEHPLLFAPGAPGRVVVARDEAGEVRSACAVLERELVLPGLRVRAGLIGSVATDPAARGRGLASAVLELAEHELAASGCLFALLWADAPEFYAARGWREAGAEVDLGLPAGLRERLPEPEGARVAVPADAGAIHALYEAHATRVARRREETAALLATPGMRVTVLERAGGVRAYACVGRGGDLAGVVHEWGGATDDVLALLAATLERRASEGEPGDLWLLAPPTAGALVEALERAGALRVDGVLGMVKLLRPDLAAELLTRRAVGAEVRAEPTPRGGLELRAEPATSAGRESLGAEGRVVLEADEVLAALLPPRGERAALDALERRLGVRWPSLPLRPFVWGLDSI